MTFPTNSCQMARYATDLIPAYTMETIVSIETTVVVTWIQVAVLEQYFLVTEYVSHRQIRNNGIVHIMLSIGMPNITIPCRSSREIGWKASANNNMIVVIRRSAKGSFLRFSDEFIGLDWSRPPPLASIGSSRRGVTLASI